jgi:hypothetical protein
MQQDPAGYVDGLNLYEYERTNPIDMSDPTGLFSTPNHTKLATTAAQGFGMKPKYIQAFVGADLSVDNKQFESEAALHAQANGWDSIVRSDMKAIKEIDPNHFSGRQTPRQGRIQGGFANAIWAILRDMGEAAHTLQDYFSHTDWVEGYNMEPVYFQYNDEAMLSAMGAVSSQSGPSLPVIWKLGPNAHQPHHGEIISMDALWSGNTSRYTNVIYYAGGGMSTLGPTFPSEHSKYSADQAGAGRDQAPPKGLRGAFNRAYALASLQSTAWVRWARDNMNPCARIEIFGY